MTKISLAGGSSHSVSSTFVRLVQGLNQKAREALCDGLILTAITAHMLFLDRSGARGQKVA